MKFGLEQHIIDNLIAVFEQHSKVDKAILFGSRAKGNYRPDSDIDIAVKGQDLHTDDIIAMSVAFEEIGITHKIDLINYDTIKEPDLKDRIDRVGIELYSRWKEMNLERVVRFGNGKERPKIEGDIPVYGGNGILGYTNQSNYEGETLIIGRVGAYCGSVYYENKPIWISDNALSAKPKNNYNAKYLFYFLKNLQLNNQAQGSSHPLVTQSLLNSIVVVLTDDIKEQTAIATILSSLDDKIDLLHRQNKTLEQLAETLFRQWFVAEAEESWEEKSFKDLIETSLGGEWGKENPEGDFQLQVQCIRGTDIADLQTGIPLRTPIRFIKQNKFESIEIKDGDLVMEISGGTDNQSTGRTTYINDNVKALFKYPLVFSNFCRLIRPKKKEYSFFIYSYIHHLYEQGDLFNLENGSSGIKNLNYKALLFELAYKLPNEKKIIQFHKDVEQYFYKINKNKFQIRTLTQTRDTLLPKLMSGEIRINL